MPREPKSCEKCHSTKRVESKTVEHIENYIPPLRPHEDCIKCEANIRQQLIKEIGKNIKIDVRGGIPFWYFTNEFWQQFKGTKDVPDSWWQQFKGGK